MPAEPNHPIDATRLLDTFLTLCRFDTPSRREKPAAEWTAAYLRDLGFEVEFDDAGEKVGGTVGNLIAFKQGTVPDAPPIFFSAHFDTVEPTPGLEIVVEGDVIRATSDTILGADDKCGMAPILEAMSVLEATGEAHGDIQLLLTICEEIGLVGAKRLDPQRIRGRYGFVLDSGPPVGALTVSAPYQNSIRVRIEGVPAHAGASPEKGVSAILAAARAIAVMTQGRIDDDTTANIGTIQGGSARNIVPAEVVLVGEARSRVKSKLDAQTAHMKEVFEREAAALGAVAHVEIIGEYQGYHLQESDPVLRIAMTAARACGLEPSLRPTGGGSDGNIFNGYGFPSTVLGCGMQKIHTHDEFCTLSDMILDAAWVLEIVRAARDFRE
ncbi:MAG: M20/M25/M40 family metallo-hydrolase [Capsulimonadales bacterium]|nr:M20/M25/M40 family metallo-hydrolase [Capsulimonadales bacterium]